MAIEVSERALMPAAMNGGGRYRRNLVVMAAFPGRKSREPTMAMKPPSERYDGRGPMVHHLPGRRAALPRGSLRPPYFAPQGDENRDPPANAPSVPPLTRPDDEQREPSLKPKR
jgi:hypothetical protein